MTDEPYTEHWYAIVKAWLWLWAEKQGVDAGGIRSLWARWTDVANASFVLSGLSVIFG